MKRARPLSRRRAAAEGEPEQILYYPRPSQPGERVRIEGGEAEHALRSLRVRSGDPIVLTDGRGRRYRGRVTDLVKHSLEVAVDAVEEVPDWPRTRLWLGSGVLRTTRGDTLVEKASELGVEQWTPLLLKRCVARPQEHGAKSDRWHRIAIESLKQCRRARIMDVREPEELGAFLERLPPQAALWVADPSGETPSAMAGVPAEDPVVLIVGPEGGLDEDEIERIRRRNGRFVRLGGHRLRAETAGITLVTTALMALGEMDPHLDT